MKFVGWSFLRRLFSRPASAQAEVAAINRLRARFSHRTNAELRAACERSRDLHEVMAITAVVAARVLGLEMFDVQIRGALALAAGQIAEMQTGEGKTLAATPAVVWHAKARRGVHVMTVNDYLAGRDAAWMGGIYQTLGFSVGSIRQGMTPAERRRAYACDITYATANEVGFDYLRDQLALDRPDQVHRPFHAALIDEADSILIDEARIPLVIAGGESGQEPAAYIADRLARSFGLGREYTLDEYKRNVAITDTGIQAAEAAFRCANLYALENLSLVDALSNALHAHVLLRRDVDYVVKNGAIESVDEFKGRIAQDRRWPAGLHAALEVKEGLLPKNQGRILGSITLQNLVALYPTVCGMTGTAATQADEFQTIYGLPVTVIPTNRPVIRADHDDVVFDTKAEKELAVTAEIRRAHQTGQPVLVGTASVAESERLSAALEGIPHAVLNACNEEQEAGIVARAGERGAVTISTNMAGRGTDIRLGHGVAELGGLYVIGTNRHESRRIDHQLRGRAGRQGDPGCSRFFVSFEDDLFARYDTQNERDPESVQRLVEGQHLEMREFLMKYEGVIEGQRRALEGRRQEILGRAEPCLATLTAIDDLWADHLARVADYRAGLQWLSLGGRNPLLEYLATVHQWFQELEQSIAGKTAERLAAGLDPRRRGATWTYLTTDLPFGTTTDRFLRGLGQKLVSTRIWGC